MKMILKDSNVLKKKPKLRLMPNHYHFVSEGGRFWHAVTATGFLGVQMAKGTAVKDGYGWYKSKGV